MRQRRLQADIGAPDQQVGDEEGVRTDPLVRLRQRKAPAGAGTASQLHPARELPADISWIDVPCEQEARFEDRLIANDLQQAVELHGSSLPGMASYCNQLENPDV